MKKQLNFTYDPLKLVRLAMDRYAEDLERKHTKAIQFARYQYLRTMTDYELNELLQQYVTQEKLDVITLKDWQNDCAFIFELMYKTTRYKKLVFQFNKAGFGTTGLGVVDNTDNTFYDCDFACHWETIMQIIEHKYPRINPALKEMYANPGLSEFDGTTKQELDDFIAQRFELIGGDKPLDEYV